MALVLTKISETSSKITLGWTPVPGAIGYRYQSATQAPKWSHTWNGSTSQVTFSKAAWYKVEALGVEEAGQYPPSTPPPTGQPIPTSGRITQGGTYSGNYTGGTIVIDTSSLVTITNAVISNTSGDMFRGLGGGFTIKNLILDHVRGICQNAGTGQGRRIFDADGPVESITVRSCTFERATGMKLSGVLSNARILIEKTKLLNPMGDADNTNSQFLQLNAVENASVEVGWNECIQTDTNAFTEDIISISGDGAYVHDNYLDGAWTFDNRASSSQGGITLEEGARNSRVENNILVATMGLVINNNVGANNSVTGNRYVHSGLLPDGVTKIKVGYGGLACFPGSPGDNGNFPYGPQNGNHCHNNVVGHMNGTTHGGGRLDWEDNDFPPDCLPTNTHLAPVGGTITRAHEDAERTRWQQKKQAAGVTVGA